MVIIWIIKKKKSLIFLQGYSDGLIYSDHMMLHVFISI